jgi:hypothetical protein
VLVGRLSKKFSNEQEVWRVSNLEVAQKSKKLAIPLMQEIPVLPN